MQSPADRLLTREQVRRVDEYAIRDWGMSGLVLMENAGRGVVDVLCQLGIAGKVVIACYKGNNGGDGFVVARHLHLRGHAVEVVLCCDPVELRGDAATNYAILERSEVPISDTSRIDDLLEHAEWVVDALLGTGAWGDPKSPLDSVIARLNATGAKKLAIDLPSGLDCDTGTNGTPTFRADETCSFVAAKPGLLTGAAQEFVGNLHVLDIGVPWSLVEQALAG